MAATGTLSPGQGLTRSVSTFYPPDRGPDIIQMIDRCLDVTGDWERRFESTIQAGLTILFYISALGLMYHMHRGEVPRYSLSLDLMRGCLTSQTQVITS
jgi:hypothetical protein